MDTNKYSVWFKVHKGIFETNLIHPFSFLSLGIVFFAL